MLGAMEGGYVIMNVTNLKTGELEAKRFPLYPISDDPDEKEHSLFVLPQLTLLNLRARIRSRKRRKSGLLMESEWDFRTEKAR